jgi:hypothetical protein
MAIGQVARLENQVKEAQRIVTVRDAKIRELQHSLSKATQSRLSAETELSRAVEMHETRMAALQLEYRSAEMQLAYDYGTFIIDNNYKARNGSGSSFNRATTVIGSSHAKDHTKTQ